MLVRSVFLSTLEAAIARFIQLDQDAPRLLQPVNGKVIAIRIEGPDWTFFLCPCDDRIQILDQYHGTPDTTLSGSLLAFAEIGLSQNPIGVLFSGKVTLEGDIETGKRFQQLFGKLDIDWEEHLSKFTGDILAHQIGNLVRTTRKWSKESRHSLTLDTREFLQEEIRQLPTPLECEHLYTDVDSVRAATDRLEMRVRRLADRLRKDDN